MMTYWFYDDVIAWHCSWPSLALTCSNWYSRMCDRQIDGLTDRWTVRPSYRDARTHLNKAHKANDASSWWHNDCMVTWLHEIILDLLWLWLVQIDIHGCATDRSMDWQTDGPVDCLIELRRCIKRASYTSYDNILLKNVDFPCFWRKRDQPTDGRTDGPTDGRTDGQTLL